MYAAVAIIIRGFFWTSSYSRARREVEREREEGGNRGRPQSAAGKGRSDASCWFSANAGCFRKASPTVNSALTFTRSLARSLARHERGPRRDESNRHRSARSPSSLPTLPPSLTRPSTPLPLELFLLAHLLAAQSRAGLCVLF